MSDRPHPILIAIAALVYLFLMLPLVIVVGAALSDTTYLAFPPQGLSLRWFENIFAISAFRRTIVTSLQIALLGTLVALLIGIPAAYALNRYPDRAAEMARARCSCCRSSCPRSCSASPC